MKIKVDKVCSCAQIDVKNCQSNGSGKTELDPDRDVLEHNYLTFRSISLFSFSTAILKFQKYFYVFVHCSRVAVYPLTCVSRLVSKELEKGIKTITFGAFSQLRNNHETDHTDFDSPSWIAL